MNSWLVTSSAPQSPTCCQPKSARVCASCQVGLFICISVRVSLTLVLHYQFFILWSHSNTLQHVKEGMSDVRSYWITVSYHDLVFNCKFPLLWLWGTCHLKWLTQSVVLESSAIPSLGCQTGSPVLQDHVKLFPFELLGHSLMTSSTVWVVITELHTSEVKQG